MSEAGRRHPCCHFAPVVSATPLAAHINVQHLPVCAEGPEGSGSALNQILLRQQKGLRGIGFCAVLAVVFSVVRHRC
jgi:hypothetical protein